MIGDRIGKGNLLLALVAGAVVFAGYSLFPMTALTPELCEEGAVVAGLRPAAGVFPGLWRLVAGLMPVTADALGLVGRIGAGLFAVFAYLCLRNGFLLLFRPVGPLPSLVRRLAPALSFLCTVTGAFAEPVWRVFSLFSPAALMLVVLALCILLAQGWLVRPRPWCVCLMSFLLGLAAAETPLALALAVVIFLAYRRTMGRILATTAVPEEVFEEMADLPIWRMLLLWTAGLAAGVGANVCYISLRDNAVALGWNVSLVLFHYGTAYAKLLADAASPVGWMLGLALAALPLLAACTLFAHLTDENNEVPLGFGLVILLLGVVAYFQQGPVRGAWFWTWADGLVRSPLLLAVLSLCASAAVAFVGGIFAYDAFGRVAKRMTPGLAFFYRGSVVVLGALAAVCVVPRLPHAHLRRVLDFNARAVAETVRELNGAKRIFTDGTSDAALELEARRLGQELYAINLMGYGDNVGVRLRLRGLTDETDRHAARLGAPVLMRVWACDKENGLSDAALQLGFELWKREKNLVPPVASAFLARTSGLREEDVADAGRIAAKFADEAVRLVPDAMAIDVPPTVRRAFFRHMWRLSRFARYRRDVALADRLDACNGSLHDMMRDVESERIRVFMQMTPREGLEIALRRADFTEATRYAAAVLKVKEDDPKANFATGMYFLLDRRYAAAEPYLRRVIEANPNEVAALNNLSILCRKTNRFDEAVKLAEAAARICPDSEEVQKTLADAKAKKP